MNGRNWQKDLPMRGTVGMQFRRAGKAYCSLTIDVARCFVARLCGLLGKAPPAPDGGLLLVPCRRIHTAGMHYAIDAVFIDARGCVLDVTCLPPWRAGSHRSAIAVLELAGSLSMRIGIEPGDSCVLDVPSGASSRTV